MSVKKHKTLGRTCLFRLSLIVPLSVGLLLGVAVFFDTELGGVCFSSSCVQNFFSHFKFPITIMGASLPLAALVAAIHRSNEAALQIDYASKQYEEAVKNNKFGNYLKHREGFEKLLSSYIDKDIGPDKPKPSINPSSIYSRLFPDSGFNSKKWFGEPGEKVFGDLERDFALLLGNIKEEGRQFDFSEFMSALCRVALIYGVNYERVQAVMLVSDGNVIVVIPGCDNVPDGVVVLLNVLVELHSMVRSYVGNNYVDDLMWGRYLGKLHSNLVLSFDLYVVDKLNS